MTNNNLMDEREKDIIWQEWEKGSPEPTLREVINLTGIAVKSRFSY
jgi:hypothetical protein